MALRAAVGGGLLLVGCAGPSNQESVTQGVRSSAGTLHYVDARKGSDANPGTSSRLPWRSLSKVNATLFAPGDKVLFAGGQVFEGTLYVGRQSNGTKDRPIVIGSFGRGRATLQGGSGDGVVLTDCAFVTVRELKIVGCGRKNGSDGAGVRMIRTQGVDLNAIEVSGFRLAGVATGGDRNTRITRVYAHDNGFAGITTDGGRPDIPRSRDLYIGYCVAENNPGDPKNLTNHSGNGIVVGGVDGAVIEYCEAMNNGWDMPWKGNGPVGIWGWNCDRLVIQHCISHDNKTVSGAVDGGGFDLDGGATHSTLQYNLSYNNHGCGYLLCQYPGAAPWKDNTCRYNISVNDGLTNHFSGIYFWAGGPDISNAQVYNNVILNSRHAVVSTHDIAGLVFRNNIFVSEGDILAGPLAHARFENNLYWSTGDGAIYRSGDTVYAKLADWAKATGQETADGRLASLFADPRLVMPGKGQTLPTDPPHLSRMLLYRLRQDSPCAGRGMPIADNGGKDFFGHRVLNGRRPSLGVHEAPVARQPR